MSARWVVAGAAMTFALVLFCFRAYEATPCSLDTRAEGTFVDQRSLAWPPAAVECRYEEPSGTVSATTLLPWRDWITAALLAAAVALVLSALGGARRPSVRILIAAASCCASVVVWFGVI